MEMQITTNHHWRHFVYRMDVPDAVLADQFDYHDEDVIDGYFHYKGCWYHLDQFMASGSPEGWDGYHGDSFFSGILIKLSSDGEQYKVATYIQKG